MDTSLSLLISFSVRMIIKVLEKLFIGIYISFCLSFICLLEKSIRSCVERVFVFPGPGPDPGLNLFLTVQANNLYLPTPVVNFCLPLFRFTVEVCYSQSHSQCLFSLLSKIAPGTRLGYSYCAYLYKLSI